MHCNENPIYVFLYWEWRGLSPAISTFMCLWAIYIFPGSVHICSSSRIGRSIVGTYKSLTDTWTWKLGLTPCNSYSGNTCFEFSVLCFCSVCALQRYYAENSRKNCAATVPVPTFIFLWTIYIFPQLVCIFCCRKIGGPIVGICKSLTDTWM